MLWVPGVAEAELAEVWSAADGIAETNVYTAWPNTGGQQGQQPPHEAKVQSSGSGREHTRMQLAHFR